MNKHAFTRIESSLVRAKDAELTILGAPMYHWNDDGTIIGCDAFGAVLWCEDRARPNFPKGWLKELCEILLIDTFWFWRFNQGWVQRAPVQFVSEKNGKEIVLNDAVGTASARLAKRYRSDTF